MTNFQINKVGDGKPSQQEQTQKFYKNPLVIASAIILILFGYAQIAPQTQTEITSVSKADAATIALQKLDAKRAIRDKERQELCQSERETAKEAFAAMSEDGVDFSDEVLIGIKKKKNWDCETVTFQPDQQ